MKSKINRLKMYTQNDSIKINTLIIIFISTIYNMNIFTYTSALQLPLLVVVLLVFILSLCDCARNLCSSTVIVYSK